MSVYLEAAQLIDEGEQWFACHAISWLETRNRWGKCKETRDFANLFAPDDIPHGSPWMYYAGETERQRKQARVFALLLMHWMTQ